MNTYGLRPRSSAIVLACMSAGLAIGGDSRVGDLELYPLPLAAKARIGELAAGSDVLILGEVHGTREMPGLVEGLLASLHERGYRALAIELPNDQQAPLLAWARGETDRVPDFFARPDGDGRGNVQLLELVRMAVAPPFGWRLVCFQDPEAILEKRDRPLIEKMRDEASEMDLLTSDEGVAIWREDDAAMASNLLGGARSLGRMGKILAICGDLHARTKHDATDPIASKFWPSFAAMVARGRPGWRVTSVGVAFSSGSYFNGGRVQAFRGRPTERAEVRSGRETGWDFVLSLPRATPATFLPLK